MTTTTPDTRVIELGGTEYRLERPSGRKASRALALLRALSRAVPQVSRALEAFTAEYESRNVIALDRVQAAVRFPPSPLLDPETREPMRDPAGELVLAPSRIAHLTDEDWERAGQVYRIPRSPSWGEQAMAVLDVALEQGEEHVYRLLAVFLIPNSELKALWRGDAGALAARIDELVDDVLDDAYADEVLELAVAVGELVDGTFIAKARALGDRLGNLGRLFGLASPTSPATPTPTEAPAPSSDGPSSSTPASSTASATPTTDGAPTTPSTPPTSSPSSSSAESPTTPPEPARSTIAA